MTTRHTYAIGTGWRGILAEVGVEPGDLLRRAELPEDLLNREDTRLDVDALMRFTRALEESVPDADFWVQLTEAMRPEFFSPSLFAALCSPNLTVAARRLALFKPLLGPMTLDVQEDDHALTLTYHWAPDTPTPPACLHAVEALFITKLARMGTRHPLAPVAVTVPARPHDVAPFEAFLGVPIQVGGDVICVAFRAEDAQRPFLTASAEMWHIFEPALRRRLADLTASATFAARTRAVLLEAIPSGQIAMNQIARRLAVSSRTLQRRLREEGTSFKEVLRTTREHLARHYLGHTQLTSTEIAYLLGFDEPTSFFRAFRGWTGVSPETLRRSIQG